MAGVTDVPPYPPPPGGPYSPPPPPDEPFGSSTNQPYSPPPFPQPYDAVYPEMYPEHPATTTNGFAIASLVLGILGPCGLVVGLILAIVFGFIALSQTKDGRQRGRGMAIAGLVCSGLWIVGLVIAFILVVVFGENNVRAIDLKVGNCIETAPTGDGSTITTLPTVSCDKPHQGEVFAIVNIPGDRWPGDSVMRREYGPKCDSALEDYAKSSAGLEVVPVYPAQDAWDAGHHDVTCIARTDDKRTGSIKK